MTEEKREKYLGTCVDILIESAYKMCKKNYRTKEGKEAVDPKILKETCLAVKEAAALLSGMKNKDEVQEIVVKFENEEYAV